MEVTLNYIVAFIQTALSLVVAVVSFTHWKRRKAYIKWIGLLFFVGFLSNTFATALSFGGYSRWVNTPGAFYDIAFVSMLSVVYYNVTGKKFRMVFIVLSVLFTITALVDMLHVSKGGTSTNMMFISSIIMLCYCVYYFYCLMVELPVIHVHRMPMFWINSGMLVYNAGTLFLFAFTKYLIEVLHSDLLMYWTFHNFLNVVGHIMVLVGLHYDLKLLRSPESDTED